MATQNRVKEEKAGKKRVEKLQIFCTIAQTGQAFDVYHRPGNVHDPKRAEEFIRQSIKTIKKALPGVKVEARPGSAFFSDKIVRMLDKMEAQFSISVPFERFAELKGQIQGRKRWKKYDERWSCFESQWKPKSWESKYRFIFIVQNNISQKRCDCPLASWVF